jgi:biotin carboxyl carrier protein
VAQYTVLVDGVEIRIELERTGGQIHVKTDGKSYPLEAASPEPGVYWFNHSGRSVEARVTTHDGNTIAAIDGAHFSVEVVDARAALRRLSHAGHEGTALLRAPMPGKIVAVLVAEGSTVQVNQGIVVMEAMKMQNEIKSPKAGTVVKLNVAAGAAVNAGETLAVIE